MLVTFALPTFTGLACPVYTCAVDALCACAFFNSVGRDAVELLRSFFFFLFLSPVRLNE